MSQTVAIPIADHRRWSVRLALGLLMVSGCLLLAALVHFNWQFSADKNAAELVEQINHRITASVARDLKNQIDSADSALAALRTIFFQDVIRIDNEAKREFVFLSMLQSKPDLSWIAFGWPDGSYFGARKDPDDNIRMVEVQHESAIFQNFRTDHYRATARDIHFETRKLAHSSYDATKQPWFMSAMAAGGPVWSEAMDFPTGEQPAIAISDRLELYGRDLGVLSVSIDLARLAKFLDRLEITRHGKAIILAPDGRLLSADGWKPLSQAPSAATRAIAAGLNAEAIDLSTMTTASSMMGRDAETDGQFYLNVSRLPYRDWSVAIAIPTEDILGDIPAATRRLYLLVIVLAVLVAGGAFLAADRLVTKPLATIAGQIRAVGNFRLDAVLYRPSFLREFDQLSRHLVQMSAGLGSFRKYLPADLVETLVSQGIEAKLGGQRRELTVLFSDLAGFTGLTESEPERMVAFLGAHLDDMSRAIHAEGGTIDKFIGDSVMAFWNAPNRHESPEIAACRAALACRAGFQAMLRHDAWSLPAAPGLRIGINTGPALVGNIGSRDRLNYTAIGDTVNVASRFESLNKQYGTDILIGETTATVVDTAFVLRRLDRVAVYGRKQGVSVYELIAEKNTDVAQPAWLSTYEAGLDAYFDRDWQRASTLFAEADGLRGRDRPSRIMIARCHAYMVAPPDADWLGVTNPGAK